MDDENKSGAMPLPPTHDDAAKPYRRSRASWAVRIVLALFIWLPQPIILFMVALGAWEVTFFYGFLGSTVYLLMPAILGIVTALIFVAGKNRKATVVLVVILAALLALFFANWVDSSSKFVDPATYDRQAAGAFDENNIENNIANNLEGGYGQYRPFTGEGVERLDEPATLRFSAGDDLPRVDAATALLPLASAFVTAAYPEEATSVQWDRWDYNSAAENGYEAGFRLALLEASDEDESSDTLVQEIMQDSKGYTGLSREGFDLGFDRGSSDGARAAAAGVQPYSMKSKNQGYFNYFDGTRIPVYDIEHPGEVVGEYGDTFQYNNSSAGFTVLAEGHTDVFFGTKADEGQAQEAREMGVEFDYTPIGREGFVFLVNASNPVDSLTVEQVKDIYSGKITNWREVGGNDEPIRAYQRNQNSGSQSMMERFMGDAPLMEAPGELSSSSMGGLVRAVAGYDNGAGAIGYSFRYYVTDLVGEYDVKLLEIEGVPPTPGNITDGSYPITGEFYAVTRAGDLDAGRAQIADDPDADTRQANLARLIEWINGEQGQELVAKSGYARL